MTLKFVDLKPGDRFSLNNQEHIRINDERINCCKVLNAKIVATEEKVQIIPITEVELIKE
jgi:hypothetical protein